jgi:hypothetical protein
MENNSSTAKIAKQCILILYVLVATLVFEGILRKLVPPLRTPLFFLKDFLCLIVMFKLTKLKLKGMTERLRKVWSFLFFLFLPLLLFTSFKDPVLAVFSAKQYLLYVVTGLLVAVSFPIFRERQFRLFLFFVTLLIIPTTFVAVLQNALPSSHWLNLSVGGDSLAGFSAAGFLRVSSTFSFTGQYSWFITAETFFLAASFFLPPEKKFGLGSNFRAIAYSVLILMLITGAFITGGRTAVLGSAATLTLGFFFLASKRPQWLFKGALILVMCVGGIMAVRTIKPEFFMVYDERASGSKQVSHNQEVTSRVLGGFTEWIAWFVKEEPLAFWLGNGLGIMSNGVSMISTYAAKIRATGFWTEGDMATTFWEGGIYLVIIWYGFRIWVMLMAFRLWNRLKDKLLVSAASVPLAYIIIQGCSAPFAIQPPLSIWWWLAIGIIIAINRFDQYRFELVLFERRRILQEKSVLQTIEE